LHKYSLDILRCVSTK